MHFVTLKIDRVFDLERRLMSKTGKFSTFSFEVAGRQYCGLEVWDWPRIDSGMVITAALARPDDVGSLKGWFDHETSEVVSPSPLGLRWFAIALWLGSAAVMFGIPGYRGTQPAGVTWIVSAVLAGGAVLAHFLDHRYRALRTNLAQMGASQRRARRES